MLRIVSAIALMAFLVGCSEFREFRQNYMEAMEGLVGIEPPKTYAECVQRTGGSRTYYNTAGAIGALIYGIGDIFIRVQEQDACAARFGVVRDDPDGKRQVQTEWQAELPDNPMSHYLLDDDDTSARARYERSGLRGAAYSTMQEVDYGPLGCRMNGAMYSAC